MAWTTDEGEFCRCLTDQGTTYKMPYAICITYAKGEVYNPYKPRAEPIAPEIQQTPPQNLAANQH
jgi:hypothetical protein